MNANPDKCHLPASGSASTVEKIKDNVILNSEGEKLLAVTVDNKLNFNNHLQKIRKTAN